MRFFGYRRFEFSQYKTHDDRALALRMRDRTGEGPSRNCRVHRLTPWEIVGLRSEDYDGRDISVRRNICFGDAERCPSICQRLKRRRPCSCDCAVAGNSRCVEGADGSHRGSLDVPCWIHPQKDHPVTLLDAAKYTRVSPANVLRDVVLPALEKKTLNGSAITHSVAGWRRLRALGVDDLTIMEILRHNEVEVPRRNLPQAGERKSVEAMDRLEANSLRVEPGGPQTRPERHGSRKDRQEAEDSEGRCGRSCRHRVGGAAFGQSPVEAERLSLIKPSAYPFGQTRRLDVDICDVR